MSGYYDADLGDLDQTDALIHLCDWRDDGPILPISKEGSTSRWTQDPHPVWGATPADLIYRERREQEGTA